MAKIGPDMTGWNEGAKDGKYAAATLGQINPLAPDTLTFTTRPEDEHFWRDAAATAPTTEPRK